MSNEVEDQAAFDLFLAFHAGATHWTAEFYRLVAKSDPTHRFRLKLAFPVEVTIWEEWQATTPERDFFASHQIERFFIVKEDRERYERFSGSGP